MARKPPSAIYRAEYPGGWLVSELLIPDFIIMGANNGDDGNRNNISMRFRTVCQRDYGIKPEWVDFDKLVLRKIRS